MYKHEVIHESEGVRFVAQMLSGIDGHAFRYEYTNGSRPHAEWRNITTDTLDALCAWWQARRGSTKTPALTEEMPEPREEK